MSLGEERPAEQQAHDALAQPVDVHDVVSIALELADRGHIRGNSKRDCKGFRRPAQRGAQLRQRDLVDLMARFAQQLRLYSRDARDVVDQSDSRHTVI